MDKEEILAKSRLENKNIDEYEREVLKQADTCALVVFGGLATVFFLVQIAAGGGINFGIYALVFAGNMTTAWVRCIKLKQREKLPHAIALTAFVLLMSGCHIYQLVTG